MSIENKLVNSLQELGMVGGGENFGGGEKFDKMKGNLKTTGENIKEIVKNHELSRGEKFVIGAPKYGLKGVLGASKLSVKGLIGLAQNSFKDFMIVIIFITFLILFAFKREWFLGQHAGNIQSSGVLIAMLTGFVYMFYRLNIFKKNKNMISRLFYYFIVIYIFHILWVILTFTNPDKLSCDMVSNRVGVCNAPGLYFGKYPDPEKDFQHSYHDYIFDIFTWFPPDFLPGNTIGHKCAACPYNQTATGMPGCNNEGRISCRDCNTNESWYSINDIKYLNASDSAVPSKYFSMENMDNIKSLKKDYDKIGVCIPNKEMNKIHQDMIGVDSGYDCTDYKECLNKGIFSDNFQISIEQPTSIDPVLSGQIFHFRKYKTPLQIKIPENRDYSSLHMDSPYRGTDYYYLDNKYGNSLCDPYIKPCTINVAIPSNISTTPPSPTLPTYLQKVREGINCPTEDENCYKNAGGCYVANKIMYGFNNPSESIVFNHLSFQEIVGKDIPTPRSLDVEKELTFPNYSNWINAVEESRKLCIKDINKGTCFVNTDNYPCTTKRGTAIPLTDNNKLVVPEFSMEGCRNALLVSNCKKAEDDCYALQVSDTGILYNKDPNTGEKNGKCKPVKYNYTGNKWVIDPLATPTDLRCIPNDNINEKEDKIKGNIIETTNLNNIPTWILNAHGDTMKVPEEMCNMVRKDNTNIEGDKMTL